MKVAKLVVLAGAVLMAAAMPLGCSTAPRSDSKRAELTESVTDTIKEFKARDESMAARFKEAYGYAVFPSVAKGGAGIGGAYGRGELFERGKRMAYCDLSQGTIGLQLGGQVYSEVIFFENKDSFNKFKSGEFAFSAQATAVAAKAGAAADADFRDGVMVFTMTQGGLMYEASIGGQKFTVAPM